LSSDDPQAGLSEMSLADGTASINLIYADGALIQIRLKSYGAKNLQVVTGC